MSSDLVKCPSGLSGMIQGLKGKSIRLLSDKQAARNGVFVDRIFSECWLETIAPGPYQFDGKPDWSKVLAGDRMYLLLQIRARTFGPVFSPKLQCTNPACRHRFDYEIDLGDLPVRELSDEDRTRFASGSPMEGTLPDGAGFRFKLLTGADEARAMRMSGTQSDPLGVLKGRIVEIDGHDERTKNSYFEDADLATVYDVLAEMDQHDCGVETRLSLECPECREALDIEIPFGSAGFLAPARRTTTR